MKTVWLIIKDEDWFYEDKNYDIDIFDTLESAHAFFKDYVNIIRDQLKQQIEEEFAEDTGLDYIEETGNKDYHDFYVDDMCYIRIYIEEKDIMSYE